MEVVAELLFWTESEMRVNQKISHFRVDFLNSPILVQLIYQKSWFSTSILISLHMFKKNRGSQLNPLEELLHIHFHIKYAVLMTAQHQRIS